MGATVHAVFNQGGKFTMPKLTKAEVERVVRAFWKKQAVPNDVQKPLPSARGLKKLGTDWLRSNGFDFKRAQALQEQHRAEWDRVTPKAAADAARRFAGHIKQTQASAAAWATNAISASVGAPQSDVFFIAKPISVLASDQRILRDSHIESGNSFAKVLVDRESSNVDTISFVFGFRNGGATPFLFDFDTLLNVSGHLRIRVGAGFINSGAVTLDAKLDVLSSSQISDLQNVATLSAISDGPPFFGGDTNERTLTLTRFLTAPRIVLESDEIAFLLVSLVVKSDLDDAHLVADFNAGNFRVLCPVVFVARKALPLKVKDSILVGATG